LVVESEKEMLLSVVGRRFEDKVDLRAGRSSSFS
jgi:hypothetical protein